MDQSSDGSMTVALFSRLTDFCWRAELMPAVCPSADPFAFLQNLRIFWRLKKRVTREVRTRMAAIAGSDGSEKAHLAFSLLIGDRR